MCVCLCVCVSVCVCVCVSVSVCVCVCACGFKIYTKVFVRWLGMDPEAVTNWPYLPPHSTVTIPLDNWTERDDKKEGRQPLTDFQCFVGTQSLWRAAEGRGPPRSGFQRSHPEPATIPSLLQSCSASRSEPVEDNPCRSQCYRSP